jgi:putative ABC transport system permease protein
MPVLLLFYRLIARPLLREPLRAGLTVLAVALGVAVVLAIDLAGDAATGSFRSSMETLAGDNDLEITSPGGVPENLMGTLASLPYSVRISPRIEDFAVIAGTRKSLPLVGLDLIAEGSGFLQMDSGRAAEAPFPKTLEEGSENSAGFDGVWVGWRSPPIANQ